MSQSVNFNKWLVLLAGFLGWMGAGVQISLFPLIGRTMLTDLFSSVSDPIGREKQVAMWFSWFVTSFLFGAALGGWVFGILGDRLGRKTALSLSVLCYSLGTLSSYFFTTPEYLLCLRFIACMGVGGTWPNAVALVTEAWQGGSKTWISGWLGAAANFGFVLLGMIAYFVPVTVDAWRWIILVASTPVFLSGFIFLVVPESASWKTKHQAPGAKTESIWKYPWLSRTILGIALGAVPTVGTAVSAAWLIPWADSVSQAKGKESKGDPRVKAWTQITRSSGAIVGSLFGGWLASMVGRRLSYFGISLLALLASEYIFLFLTPDHPWFSTWVFIVGVVGVTYFGWLPLYLPELFSTAVRATGIGVAFNFGRIVAGFFALGSTMLVGWFGGDYAKIGAVTSLVFGLGLVIILFAPDTSKVSTENSA